MRQFALNVQAYFLVVCVISKKRLINTTIAYWISEYHKLSVHAEDGRMFSWTNTLYTETSHLKGRRSIINRHISMDSSLTCRPNNYWVIICFRYQLLQRKSYLTYWLKLAILEAFIAVLNCGHSFHIWWTEHEYIRYNCQIKHGAERMKNTLWYVHHRSLIFIP